MGDEIGHHDGSQVMELLREQLTGFRCLVCGKDEFVPLDQIEEGLRTNLMLYADDNPTAKKHAPLVTIACTNCGRLEQFAEEPLRKRLEKSATK